MEWTHIAQQIKNAPLVLLNNWIADDTMSQEYNFNYFLMIFIFGSHYYLLK